MEGWVDLGRESNSRSLDHKSDTTAWGPNYYTTEPLSIMTTGWCYGFVVTTTLTVQGRSDGGIWVYIRAPKSVQVNFLWGKNDVRTAIEQFYTPPPPKKKQFSGYVYTDPTSWSTRVAFRPASAADYSRSRRLLDRWATLSHLAPLSRRRQLLLLTGFRRTAARMHRSIGFIVLPASRPHQLRSDHK